MSVHFKYVNVLAFVVCTGVMVCGVQWNPPTRAIRVLNFRYNARNWNIESFMARYAIFIRLTNAISIEQLCLHYENCVEWSMPSTTPSPSYKVGSCELDSVESNGDDISGMSRSSNNFIYKETHSQKQDLILVERLRSKVFLILYTHSPIDRSSRGS